MSTFSIRSFEFELMKIVLNFFNVTFCLEKDIVFMRQKCCTLLKISTKKLYRP